LERKLRPPPSVKFMGLAIERANSFVMAAPFIVWWWFRGNQEDISEGTDDLLIPLSETHWPGKMLSEGAVIGSIRGLRGRASGPARLASTACLPSP
jgi:hypothetical protein